MLKIGRKMFFTVVLVVIVLFSIIFMSISSDIPVEIVLAINEQKELPEHQLEQQLLFYSPYSGSVISMNKVTYPGRLSVGEEIVSRGNSQKLGAAKISITREGFEPREIKVKVNQKLVWKNKQEKLSALVLGVREIYGVTSGILEPGQEFEQEFSQPGVYTYVDGIVLGRVGKIVVQ